MRAQDYKRVIFKKFQRYAVGLFFYVHLIQDVFRLKPPGFGSLIALERCGYRKQEMFLHEKSLFIYFRIHRVIVNDQVQISGKQFLLQLARMAFYHVHLYIRIGFVESVYGIWKHKRHKQKCTPYAQPSGPELV